MQSSITDAWVKEAQKYVTPTRLAKHTETLDNHSLATEDSLDSHSQANPGPESICSSCVVLILLYLGNAEYYDQGPLNTSFQQNGIFLVLF